MPPDSNGDFGYRGLSESLPIRPAYQPPAGRRINAPSGSIPFGVDFDKLRKDQTEEIVAWNPAKIANHHIGIVGSSGSGKTYMLRKLIASLPEDVEIDIMDWHGDLEISVPDSETCLFSEQTRWGYNPLILNCDLHYGGLRRGVGDLIDAINSTSRKLGPKQEFCLRNLLTDTYAKWGIFPEQPDTWQRRIMNTEQVAALKKAGNPRAAFETYPTIQDVHDFAMQKLKSMYLGSTGEAEGDIATAALSEMGKQTAKLKRAVRKLSQIERASESDFDVIEKLKSQKRAAAEAAKLAFDNFIDRMDTGREFEESARYGNEETIRSVLYRLENLIATGIFAQNPPPFGNARVRRYFLRPLAQSPDELAMFIRFRMRAIIREMMQEGQISGRLKRVIVLDESGPFASEGPENPVNVIATQMRKFGLGLILASQTPEHFTSDFIKNAATMILLSVSTADYDTVSRTLKIDKASFSFLKPQETAMVRFSEVGQGPRLRRTQFIKT